MESSSINPAVTGLTSLLGTQAQHAAAVVAGEAMARMVGSRASPSFTPLDAKKLESDGAGSGLTDLTSGEARSVGNGIDAMFRSGQVSADALLAASESVFSGADDLLTLLRYSDTASEPGGSIDAIGAALLGRATDVGSIGTTNTDLTDGAAALDDAHASTSANATSPESDAARYAVFGLQRDLATAWQDDGSLASSFDGASAFAAHVSSYLSS